MSRDDYYTPPVLLIGRTPIQRFADDLIMAGHETNGGGLRWRAFHSRAAVRSELARRGYELTVDGDDARPELLRFWASRPVSHTKEWWQSWNEVRQAREQESAARVALPRELEALAKELHR